MSFSSDTKRELSALKPNGASEDALSLRRLFLEKGTMTNPARDYHMEFACASLEEAQALCSFLAYLPELSVTPGVTKRKGQYVVYVKGSEQITDLLAFIGANKAAMEFMQVKMVKEVRNYVNRTTNFETANIGKTGIRGCGTAGSHSKDTAGKGTGVFTGGAERAGGAAAGKPGIFLTGTGRKSYASDHPQRCKPPDEAASSNCR